MKKQEIALEKSAELWNSFMDIPLTEMHPDDTNDFRNHLHALQNILYTQLYKNKKPIVFTITGKDLAGVINNTIDRNGRLE
ncbi:DNA ligase [Flavobacterium phage 11b]|uniref:DNA ligase n=1 Tax=Flavobacterium phage 11b TaxID=294631 RepID=UPI000044412F|nr:DNA ligase [Flavobacterium phage 11b]CAH56644.1 hypothetical protein PHG11b_17 [Flavobacterium phage 11b]